MRIALLGDRQSHRSHQELDALVPRLKGELDVDALWVPTDSPFDVHDYDGVWLVPGSPYADARAVLAALTTIRTEGIPFLGTCAGVQYAVVEYVRSALGSAATHAESHGESADNVVVPLACSLVGEVRRIEPVAGSRFASWIAEPFDGMHFCSYAPSADAVGRLQQAGVVVGAVAQDAGAEVLEFPDHPFYVGSLFQPHIGALSGAPIHPLIRAYVKALSSRRTRR